MNAGYDRAGRGSVSCQQVFVVGTGRCGSTMLSKLLRHHHDTLSISEFFVSVMPDVFPAEPISGPDLWHKLSVPRPSFLLRWRFGLETEETIYPLDGGGRFDRTSCPPISEMMLPHISNDHDGLLDELAPVVSAFPTAPAAVQYRRLFDWLAARFGKQRWIERSGASLRLVDRLVEGFPDARFVHLYRDGVDTALSMSKHKFFRFEEIRELFVALCGVDPYDGGVTLTADEVPEELRPFLPEVFSREAFDADPLTLRHYAAQWSSANRFAMRTFRRMDPEQVLHVSFEDLIDDPAKELTRIAGFLDMDEVATWLAAAVPLVGRPGGGAQRLDPDTYDAMRHACRAGERALVGGGLHLPHRLAPARS